MNCNDARFTLAAEPRSVDTALLEHLSSCASCAAYAADMHELDRRLRDALAIPTPEVDSSGERRIPLATAPSAVVRPSRPLATRRLALAATVVGVVVLAGALWGGFPRASLASAVVAHMSHEPDSWAATNVLDRGTIDSVMSASGLRLDPGSPDVVYASSCRFRGRYVPHLVVRTATGPVTVLVLPHESVAVTARIDEDGYRGTLVAAPRGSIAVLERQGGDVDGVVQRVLAALVFENPTG
jgi:hypothetical protein